MSEANKHNDDAAKKAAEETAAAKAAKKAKASDASPPAWQDPDYDGPLDGEQAMWRNKHIKRLADGHATKPAKAVETK